VTPPAHNLTALADVGSVRGELSVAIRFTLVEAAVSTWGGWAVSFAPIAGI